MAKPEAEEKLLQATRRIEHSLYINDATLLAMLKRCGHEMDDNTIDVIWSRDEGVRVKWTTSVL